MKDFFGGVGGARATALVGGLAVAGLMMGCDGATLRTKEKGEEGKMTAEPASQALDPAKVCREVCQRATTCGTESLQKSIKGDPTEVALVNKVRSRENETRQACETTCLADQGEAGLEATNACLSQEGCEPFASCVERAAAVR